MGRDDSAAELYKVPELAALGRVFRSTSPIELTESETEYVVAFVKHVMDNDHVVLEFLITNTIADQLLVDACQARGVSLPIDTIKNVVQLGVSLQSTDDADAYNVVQSISAPKLQCGMRFSYD